MSVSLRVMAVLAAVLAVAGCRQPIEVPDANMPVLKDGGFRDAGDDVPPWMRQQDAGFVYNERFAGEKCPDEAFGGVPKDGGEYTVTHGMCVALRELKGTAVLNSMPVQGNTEIHFTAAQFESQILRPVDSLGRYNVKVMRGRYDILKYHPDGIWPNHKGFQEFGLIDMSKDQQRDLSVTSHSMRGGAFFGGLPFVGVQFPPDVYIRAAGLPPDQHAGATSVGGGYELALMDGTMALLLNTPPEALQGTQLIDYPLTWSYQLRDHSMFDINIPGSELEGHVTVDGVPLADRKPGPDFELNYTPSGEQTVVAVTHHEGGISGFHSLLPKGKYSVTLSFDSIPDPHFPAQVFNKQVVQTVDLNENATVSKNFTTVPIEGGITIDGRSPIVNPGYNWTLYMYAYAGSVEPWSFAYYKVPLDSGSFTLRAFPGIYFVAIMLSDDLAPDLVDGFARVSRMKEIYSPTSLPIAIETATFSGKLLIDGKPPPVGQEAGTIILRQSDQSFSRRIYTAPDGEFRIRAPIGAYEVFFVINRNTFPNYASGRERLVSRLELFEDQQTDLIYDTVPVRGPIRLGGAVVPDNLGGDDVQVVMKRRQDDTTWTWGFAGGDANYYMRIPSGLYEQAFRILQDAQPDVAWGEAPLGYQLAAFSPFVRPSPAR